MLQIPDGPALARRLTCLFCLFVAPCLRSVFAEPTPFDLNMDRVKVSSFGGSLASSKTFFVPTVNLMISAYSSVWAQAKNGSANSQAHAKVYVRGLDKEVLQDLARKIQDDLVKKLRAGGFTVLTYDDLKTEPEIAAHGRDKPDEKYGLPTTGSGEVTYVVASPSDEQTFDKPVTGPVFWLTALAKQKDLIVIVPEITFNVPVVTTENSVGYKTAQAGLSISPVMKLMGGMVWTTNAKGTVNMQIQEHGKRLAAEVAGTTKKMYEDKTDFSSSWGRTSADYLFTLNQEAFTNGILRVGYAINSMAVGQIAKAKK